MKTVRYLLWFMVLVVAVTVAIANGHQVSIHFSPLPYSWDLPLYALLFLTLILGGLLGAFGSWLSRQKRPVARESDVDQLPDSGGPDL